MFYTYHCSMLTQLTYFWSLSLIIISVSSSLVARCVTQQEREKRQYKHCLTLVPALSDKLSFFSSSSLLFIHFECSYLSSFYRILIFVSHHTTASLLLLFYNTNFFCSTRLCLYHVFSIMGHLTIWMYNVRCNRRHRCGKIT